ncbi:MAG: hypothetical protein J2P34_10625 [Actinobacteria bacterium]|nr:hypothetical protein [Actinomycetota bacterium]
MTEPAAAETAATSGTGTSPGRASGYRLVLPPGWHHIPLRQGTDQAIKAAVDAAARSAPAKLPRDQLTAYRLEQTRRLGKLAAEARQQSGIDLYLPVGLFRGIPVPASFLVSEVSLDLPEMSAVPSADFVTEQVMAGLTASEGNTRKVTVAGAAAARTERTGEPEPSREIEYASRRVDYVIAVPGAPGRYLLVAFSTLGGGNPDDELARLLMELFDAMMATWRWNWTCA